ncbi:MAG: antibiotic biosynthesis monooxygenase [Burkholderiaceae bacterium]|nr:antibiotic biosynthesis monooxygenase [Sulfuritalea sp.]MCF8173755.1 antibiotic biosynthesis monooxygenase [Burkholderiaceae bacterium]
MYVIAVNFTIHQESLSSFMPLMLENARLSRETEPGCRRFDVCFDPEQPEQIFLYEIYDDRTAFEAHLATAHFKSIDNSVKAMVAAKVIHVYELAND